MKKIAFLLILTLSLFGQNLYFKAFKNINMGKRIINQNPQKAQELFSIAANDLQHLIKQSIKNNKPSTNAIELMGELYLNGWGVYKNERKAQIYLCIASKLGNFRAQQLVKKNNFYCQQINLKEIQQ